MNNHTIRARIIAQQDYLTFSERNKRGDITAWMNNMQSRGLAANTIRQRVSLVRQWLGTQEYVSLPPRHNVRENMWLSPEQVRAILACIPNDANGWHSFALIAIILITGQRLGQVHSWRWGDLDRDRRMAFTNKGYFPKVVLDILQSIEPLRKVAHSNTMHLLETGERREEYIFAAMQRRQRPAKLGGAPSHAGLKNQPLSQQEINRRIKRYARLVGLEPQGISVEALRRTHKRLGEDILIPIIRDFLSKRNTSPVQWKRLDRDSRLHGIGRRGRHS